MDNKGIVQKGITRIEGKDYFLGERTGRLITGWVNADDGNTYYMDNKGIVQKGITRIEGKDYFLGERTGRLITGWVNADDGNTYYMDNKGIVQKGITKIEGKDYFLGERTGRLITGWVDADDGNTYYMDNEGIVQTGTILIDGLYYQFLNNGILISGWKVSNNKTYYYDINNNKLTGVQKIAGVKYLFDKNGVLVRSNISKIIDVSVHQGNINWSTVASTDIDGAIIRLGYGTSYITDACVEDGKFSNNYYGSIENRLLKGIYLYSYAIDFISANKEANFVLSKLKQYNISKDVTIYYDLESNSWTKNLTSDQYETIVKTFILPLNEAGYTVQVYSYKFWAETKFNDFVKSKLTWIAQYADECTYSGKYNGWQYSSTGNVKGINGNVDLSIFW